jgi:hypothetical protein
MFSNCGGALPGGVPLVIWVSRVDYIRDIYTLNEIWVQGTYFDRHFAWLKYFTYNLVPVLAPK